MITIHPDDYLRLLHDERDIHLRAKTHDGHPVIDARRPWWRWFSR